MPVPHGGLPGAGLRLVVSAGAVGLRRHLVPHVVPGDAVYLLSERGATALRGTHVEALVPLLDGTRDREALLADAPGVPPERVDGLLHGLSAAGLIATADPHAGPTAPPATLAYWDASGLDADAAARRVAAARIGVRALPGAGPGNGPAAALESALDRAGAGSAGAGDRADLVVVLCGDLADAALAEVAAELEGVPWLLAKTAGTRIAVGPFLLPAQGACWHCLAAQVVANRPLDAHLHAAGAPPVRSAVELAPVPGIGVQVAAAEAVKWVAGYRHPGQRDVWTFDSFTLETARHAVRVLPQCAHCGDPALVRRRGHRPVVLDPAPVRSRTGGHRTLGPEEVLARYRPLVSPLTGVVTDVWRDPRGPEGVHSFRSGTNPAAGEARGVHALRSAVRGENGGKGVTALDAEVSALCEALERWSGTFHGDEPTETARYTDLDDRAVHPDACRLQDPRQVLGRVAWNAAHGPFQHVTEAFDETAELPWTPVWSLTAQRHRLLPTGMLYYGAPGPASVAADSNGCAAGTCLTDAVLQGLLEVVERDAVALWWYNRTPLPGVDLAAADPWVQEMRRVHAGAGRELWALDLTADLGIPVYVALSRRTASSREQILFGFGAHLDPEIALRRAVTEVNQGLPALDGLDPGAVRAAGDPDLARWIAGASLAGLPWLAPDPAAAVRTTGHHPWTPRPDLADDVADVQRRVEAAGMEVLVLDQTRPDVGLPVVRVVVPGMRHMWARFAPGRLFDVPVRLGRLHRPTRYEDLNPVPVFL